MSQKTIGIIVIVALLVVLVVASAFVFKKSKQNKAHLPTPCTPAGGGQGVMVGGVCSPISGVELPGGLNLTPH